MLPVVGIGKSSTFNVLNTERRKFVFGWYFFLFCFCFSLSQCFLVINLIPMDSLLVSHLNGWDIYGMSCRVEYVGFIYGKIAKSSLPMPKAYSAIDSCWSSCIWLIATRICYTSHKCVFLTSLAPFKREINRLSNCMRFIAKKTGKQ